MKIGIVGAGRVGSALARRFRELQHTVLIANSHGPETLRQVAYETGAIPVSASGMANGVDLLVIAVPMKSIPLLPQNLLANLPATSPVIDTGNYYPLRDGRIAELDAGMPQAEWTSKILGRSVTKAFNNIYAQDLLQKGRPKGATGRFALPVSGNDIAQKRVVMELVEAVGFDALDVGALSESWRYQPGTPAYAPDLTLQQLRRLLQRANKIRAQLSTVLWSPGSWPTIPGLLFTAIWSGLRAPP